MQKIYIDKIASAIVCFLRSRAQTKKTFSIDIDEGFKNYLVQNYNINHRNYLNAEGLAGRHRLRRYFRHHTEEYIVTITSFEIKLSRQTVKTIQKRVRTLSVKSPLRISMRLTKFRVARVDNNHNESLDSLLEYDRSHTAALN